MTDPLETNSTLARRLPPLRFTLRSLLFALTILGVFLGIWNSAKCSWEDAWRAAVSLCVCIGLAEQAKDWWEATMHRGVRCAWEIGWRATIGLLLIVFASERVVQHVYADWFEELEYYYFFQSVTTNGWLLALLVALGELPSQQRTRPDRSRRELVYLALASLAIPVVGFFTVGDMGLMEQLVAIATVSMENMRPTHWLGQPFLRPATNAENWRAFHLAGIVACCLLMGLWLVSWWGLNGNSRGTRRSCAAVWVTLLVGLIALNCQADALLWQIYPHRQPKIFVPYYFGNLLLIAALFTAAAVAVLLRQLPEQGGAARIASPLSPRGGYTHERALVLLLLLVIVATPVFYMLLELAQIYFRFGKQWLPVVRGLGNILTILVEILLIPTTLLSLATSIVITRSLWQLVWPVPTARPTVADPLPIGRALLLSLAIVAQLAITVCTLYWTKAALISLG